MVMCGAPEHVRSDNSAEFRAKAVRERLSKIGYEFICGIFVSFQTLIWRMTGVEIAGNAGVE